MENNLIVISSKNKVGQRKVTSTVRPSLPYQGIARRALDLKPSRPRIIWDDDFVIITNKNFVVVKSKLYWQSSPFIKGANIQFIVAPTGYYHHKVIDRSKQPSCYLCKVKKNGR